MDQEELSRAQLREGLDAALIRNKELQAELAQAKFEYQTAYDVGFADGFRNRDEVTDDAASWD